MLNYGRRPLMVRDIPIHLSCFFDIHSYKAASSTRSWLGKSSLLRREAFFLPGAPLSDHIGILTTFELRE